MAEWSNAAVLKTVEGHTSGGSNPSFSAKRTHNNSYGFFVCIGLLIGNNEINPSFSTKFGFN